MSRLGLLWAFAVVSVNIARAQAPDVPEPGSVEAISAATTDSHFVSPLVSYIPQAAGVPSPEKFFGRIMGAPGELVGTEKAYAYARALAAASPRVRVFTIGHSEEGRDILMLAIADEGGIRDTGSPQVCDCCFGRSAAYRPGRRREADRSLAADLLLQRRPAFGRNGIGGG